MIQSGNIYYRARAEAARVRGVFASRQRAAELLYVSAEALSDYEGGQTVPPCDVVTRMIEVYDAAWLRSAHLKAACPLMSEAAAEDSELRAAALSWITQAGAASELALKYAALALDGRVDDGEIGTAREIRHAAAAMLRAAQATIDALDSAIRRE